MEGIALKLTEAERWILINQYRLLAAADPSDAKHCEDAITVLENGYEQYYGEFAGITPDHEIMSARIQDEVVEVLSMHSAMLMSFRNLQEKADITQRSIEFAGFDGNEEIELYAFVGWFLNWGHGRFTELGKQNDYNSHTPMMETYRRMLEVWSRLGRRQQLSLEEIKQIIDAKYPRMTR